MNMLSILVIVRYVFLFHSVVFYFLLVCLFVVKVYIVAVDPQFQFKFLYIYANRELEKKMS